MLDKLINPQFSRKSKKRVGRGPGSGLGKTSGKGHKGQKSRSGYNRKSGFEGGQTPLYRRLPKKGFINIHAKDKNCISISRIVNSSKLKEISEIDYDVLYNAGLIKFKNAKVKLIANGEIDKPLILNINSASKAAITKVEAAGGKVNLIQN